VTDDLPVFEGSGKLLRLIAAFLRRPKRGECPKPDVLAGVPQGRQGLPVICLVSAADPADRADPTALARGIGRFVREAHPRRVPNATLSFPPEPRPSGEKSFESVRTVLELLAQDLSSSVNGRDGRVRFRRFGLVNWLMQQGRERFAGRPGQADPQHDRTLLEGLQEREIRRRGFLGILRGPDTELAIENRAPWWLWLALRVVPSTWLWVLRALGAEYRWLRRQP
jgi:hypothetical protein